MADSNALLAYLMVDLSYTNRIEEAATQSLAYVLARSAAARNALRNVVRAGGTDIGRLDIVDTEVIGENQKRPDVALYDDAGVERLLVENKFWADLTKNQPETYLERLKRVGEPCALLFVAPGSGMPHLWGEICRRAGVSGDATRGPVRSVITPNGVPMMLTSWGYLLARIEAVVAESLRGDVRQLRLLCQRMNELPGLPDVPWLLRLIDEATYCGRGEGYLNTRGLRWARQWHGNGRYLGIGRKDPSQATAWLGVNSHLWSQFGNTPLWLMFVSNFGKTDLEKVRRGLADLHLGPYVHSISSDWTGPNAPIILPFEFKGFPPHGDGSEEAIPPDPTSEEYAQAREAITERLREIADLLDAAD